MRFESVFGIGDTVYLKLRPEKKPGIVCSVARITLLVTWSDGSESSLCALELTSTYLKDFTNED